MITGHIKVYFSATDKGKRRYCLYHPLRIGLYVPVIPQPWLYPIVLEADKGVQCILLYHSVISASVPNMFKRMLRLFRSNQQCTHNHYLNMFGLYKAACLVCLFFPIGKLRNISGSSLGFQSKKKISSYIQCIQQKKTGNFKIGKCSD